MTATSSTTRVHVILPTKASSTCGPADLAAITGALQAGVSGLADDLGIPLHANVTIDPRAARDDREFRHQGQSADPAEEAMVAPLVSVAGRPVTPQPGALLRAAYALPPSSPVRTAVLRRAIGADNTDAEDTSQGREAGAIAGASHAVAEALSSRDEHERRQALHLITVDLVLATLRREPSLLATDRVAREWLSAANPGTSWSQSWNPRELLRAILDSGLSARLHADDHAALTAAAGCTHAQEAAQWLVSRAITRPSLMLRLHPGVLAELAGSPVAQPGPKTVAPDALKDWPALATAISSTTGVLVPPLRLVGAAGLPPGTVQVNVLARTLGPLPVPKTDLDTLALETLPLFTGGVHALREVGRPPSTATAPGLLASLLSRVVAAEVMSAIDLLLDAEQVAYRTSQVEDGDPELVNIVLGRLPLPQLTLLLRRLLVDAWYPTDLTRVFELIAEADWLPVDAPGLRALDPRPLVAARGRDAAAWRRTLGSLRRWMITT